MIPVTPLPLGAALHGTEGYVGIQVGTLNTQVNMFKKVKHQTREYSKLLNYNCGRDLRNKKNTDHGRV